jgi:cytochrome c oxidase subunit 2
VGKWWSLLFAAMMIFCGGTFVVAPFFGWWLPEGVSTHSASVDYLFYVILAITGFFFVLTEIILCVFMYKYASGQAKSADGPREPGFASRLFRPVTNLLSDQHKVEMAWTIVPALILLYIAFAQVNTWANVKYQSRMPTLKESKTPLQVVVSARQFEWRVRYPSPERLEQWLRNKDDADVARDYNSFAKVEQQDDVHVVNQLHAVVQNPTVVHLTTRDVIHSFNLPHLRVKQDALPGKMIPLWFTPTKSNVELDPRLGAYVDGYNPKTGRQDQDHIWDLACAELCGWGHYRMVGRLFVHKDMDEFLDWLRKEKAENQTRQREGNAAR